MKEFGADVTINIKPVKTQTPYGYGADVVFEGTGVQQSTRKGIDMLREADYLSLDFYHLVHGHIQYCLLRAVRPDNL